MDDITLAHFVYWIQEQNNNRGLKGMSGVRKKMSHILDLKEEFYSKYPNGRLTGFSTDITPFN